MKKLLFFLLILLSIQNFSYAKLIEFEKCYSSKNILNSNETDLEKPENLKWSEEYYKVKETHLYHSFDPKKYDKIIKLGNQSIKLGEKNNFSIYFYNKEIGPKQIKERLKEIKELEKQGYYKVNPTRELIFSINPKNGIITRTIIFSSDEMNAQSHAHSWHDLRLEKEGRKPFKWDYEKIKNLKYKIDNLSGGIIQATEINSSEPQKITINIKSGLITLITSLRSYEMTEFFICKSISGGSNKNDYTQYWWAVILIAAVIFFIYTQTGKELKIRK